MRYPKYHNGYERKFAWFPFMWKGLVIFLEHYWRKESVISPGLVIVDIKLQGEYF